MRFIDLGRYADAGVLDAALRRALKDCIDEGIPTILFLDALDECRVNIKRAETVIEDVLLEVDASALRIVITCRTRAWPRSLEDTLRRHWQSFKESAINIFEIAPYSRGQVAAALNEREIGVAAFFQSLLTSGAYALSLQPLGLRFLISQFGDGEVFSSSRWTLYERGCAALLNECERRREYGNLSLPDGRLRLQLAGFVAAAALLTNKTDIRLDDCNEGESEQSWLDNDQLMRFPLRFGGSEWCASRAQFAEVLHSGLFTARGGGIFTFTHRTYAEFLAAHFIASLGLSIPNVMALITLPDGSGRLVPQLRELAAWLGQQSQQLLSLVVSAEPMLVFDSSVSLSDEIHVGKIFDELTHLIERRRYPIYDYKLIRSYSKLAHPSLLEKLLKILGDKSRVGALRQFAADVASACGHVDQIPSLVSIALDAAEDYELRQSAANAIRDSQSQLAKKEIIPLMKGGCTEDVDDELKGIALHCALDIGDTLGSLIEHVQQRKNSNHSGAYAHALYRLQDLGTLSSDMPHVLGWLHLEFSREHLEHSWEDFVFHMFGKAALMVMSSDEYWYEFGKVAWLALSNHHRLSTSRETSEFDKGLELAERPERRLKVFESILDGATGNPRSAAGILRYGTGLLTETDGAYLIATYERATHSEFQRRIIANLILGYLGDGDGTVREWLLESAGPHAKVRDALLADVSTDYIDAVVLNSDKANKARETLALMRRLDTPSPPTAPKGSSLELLLAALTRAESGDTWEWLNMLSYLRFEEDFLGYYTFSCEVTTSPLWATLDEGVQRRICTCAAAYLRDAGPVERDLAPNQSHQQEDGGIAALVLLHTMNLHGSTGFMDLLVKWARGVARYNLDGQPRAVINRLLDMALRHSPDDMMQILSDVCHQYLKADLARLPDFAEGFMPQPLRRQLEVLLPTLQSESAFLALCKFLDKNGSQAAAINSLVARVDTLPDLSVPFATSCMALLARRKPERMLNSIWLRLRALPQAVAALAAEMQVSVSGHAVPLLLIDAEVTEQIFEILEGDYPSSSDIAYGGIVKWQHYVQHFRNACLYSLRELASRESIAALQRISERYPDRMWIASLLHDAEQKAVRDSWIPYDVQEALAALGIAKGRVVRTERELHLAVVGELVLIAEKISGHSAQPAVYFLWDEASKRPKHEPRLCDWLTIELRDRLSTRGAIVNREVQVRSHSPTGIGERTDILVEVSAATGGDVQRPIRVVIEVKGCWNDDLLSAPASQLRDNYMNAFGTGVGIYLVMWFMCDTWSDDDRRKKVARRLVPSGTAEECLRVISSACDEASSETTLLSPFVFDCTF
ncbi:NACHT domain-containing protein [Cupriavidus basilensis]|uniref:NACHT domain-containing protein n=1 Tax=Cupriavidus basilensis TaxID=68895 RepID=UPI0011858E65|nr:hypothetical protein [Cupriavidus basilensis]